MTLPVLFRPEASDDYLQATNWYDQQRMGLGDYFVTSVEVAIETIASHPEIFPIVGGNVRRALVRRFPYAIYYRVTVDRITIAAIFHVRRDPIQLFER